MAKKRVQSQSTKAKLQTTSYQRQPNNLAADSQSQARWPPDGPETGWLSLTFARRPAHLAADNFPTPKDSKSSASDDTTPHDYEPQIPAAGRSSLAIGPEITGRCLANHQSQAAGLRAFLLPMAAKEDKERNPYFWRRLNPKTLTTNYESLAASGWAGKDCA